MIDIDDKIFKLSKCQQEGMEAMAGALKEMALASSKIKDTPSPNSQPAKPSNGKTTKNNYKTFKEQHEDRRKKFNEAPVCKHCNSKHPWVVEEKC